jgi:hypothetical protein
MESFPADIDMTKLKPDPRIPEATRRLLQRDFEELVAAGTLPDCPAAADDFISGWLWFEELLLRQRSPPALRLVRSHGNDDDR